ncbi:Proteinaceous RNase P 1, chloroplastic/mitochondrial, variant 3 [Ancistrocladus abbreviatus]
MNSTNVSFCFNTIRPLLLNAHYVYVSHPLLPFFHHHNAIDSFNSFCLNNHMLLRFSSIPAFMTSTTQQPSFPMGSSTPLSSKERKKARRELPENVLKHKLDMCCKQNDLREALHLYDDARVKGIPLSQHHYNALLYLCSSSLASTSTSASTFSSSSGATLKVDLHNAGQTKVGSLGLERGFEIFKQMGIDKVAPNESTFTSLARLAASKEDPKLAFDLVGQMKSSGIPPKLRSYEPALFGFCKKGDADKAYEVDAHMIESGVVAEEPELSALLKVSVDAQRDDKVYEMLHRLRASVRQVSEVTAGIVEDWFKSEIADKVGVQNWDVGKVKEGVLKGGGGWHGQGWLGSGRWRVVRTQMDERSVCCSCGEKLVCIDIDPRETENFSSALATLACEREVKADFVQFQEWLHQHGPFDAVVDGANVGLVNQQKFSFFQLRSVVKQLQDLSPSKKLPLVVLHRSRVYGGPAQHPNNKKLLESWRKSGALYATPCGSNDDWYWLYAAVRSKCLLVTNDEMRDHLFQLLGNGFFPRWKEKHQESEEGSWHIPTVSGDDIERPRQWVCATRARAESKAQLSDLFASG